MNKMGFLIRVPGPFVDAVSRLTLALVAIPLAALSVRFALRTMLAAWLVFPSPLPNPEPTDGTNSSAVSDHIELAARWTPGEAHYPFLAAQLHQQGMRAGWLAETATSSGFAAMVAAQRALALLPTNPYYHWLAGSVALDLALHPASSPDQVAHLIDQAVDSMKSATARGPSWPLVHQQVGLELLRAWSVLDEDSRSMARRVLRQAVAWDPSFLETALTTVWARQGGTYDYELFNTLTPDTAAGRSTLARFLEREAQRMALADPAQFPTVRSQALTAHRQALELSGLGFEHLQFWIGGYQRLHADEPHEFLEAATQLASQYPARPEPQLALAIAAAATGDATVERRAAAVAVISAVAGLAAMVSDLGQPGHLLRDADPEALRSLLAGTFRALDSRRQPERGQTLQTQISMYVRVLRYQADLWFRDQLWDPALEGYRRLAVLEPRDAYALIQAGRCLDALDRSEEALASYQVAVRAEPRSSAARQALARAYFQRHEYLAAIDQWRALLARNPRDTRSRVEIARAFGEMGLLAEAVREYTEALEKDPGNASVRREMDEMVQRLRGQGRVPEPVEMP